MRIVLRALAFGVATTLLASVDLAACGDKYLRLATRLGPGYTAEHRATLLIYMPPGSAVPAAAKSLRLHEALKRAGHSVYTVENEADLATTLAKRPYDIVVVDGATVGTLASRLQRAPGRPSLIPIFDKQQSRQQLAEARTRLGCLIAAREKVVYAVAEIDHVMDLRKTAKANP